MSNASKLIITAITVRAAGAKDFATGKEYGGRYFPEAVNNGVRTTARFEFNAYVNGMGYTDEQGIFQEGRRDIIKITAWNGRNSKPGGGLADLCAKAITKGKEVSCSLSLRNYKQRLFIDNKPQVDHLGREILEVKTGFTMTDLPIWGNDAAAIIAAEIHNYRQTGQATFASRPPFWNVAGHPDEEIWKVIKKSRKEAQYIPGSTTFGHALVMVPAGAQLMNTGGNAGTDPAAMMAMLQAMMAAQQKPAPAPEPVAPVQTPALPAGIDPAMMAAMLAQFGGANNIPNTPPMTAAAGSVLNGKMPI